MKPGRTRAARIDVARALEWIDGEAYADEDAGTECREIASAAVVLAERESAESRSREPLGLIDRIRDAIGDDAPAFAAMLVAPDLVLNPDGTVPLVGADFARDISKPVTARFRRNPDGTATLVDETRGVYDADAFFPPTAPNPPGRALTMDEALAELRQRADADRPATLLYSPRKYARRTGCGLGIDPRTITFVDDPVVKPATESERERVADWFTANLSDLVHRR